MMVSTTSGSIQTADITDTGKTIQEPPNINPSSEIQLEGVMKSTVKASKMNADGDDDGLFGTYIHTTDIGGTQGNDVVTNCDKQEDQEDDDMYLPSDEITTGYTDDGSGL